MNIKSIYDEDIVAGDLVAFPKNCLIYEETTRQGEQQPDIVMDLLTEERVMYVLNPNCGKYRVAGKNMHKVLYKNKIYYMPKYSQN